jgi:hypothetical protein
LNLAPSDSWIAMIPHWQPRVLREYSLIADGERGAVVGPDGAIVWLCMPRWDSPAVISAFLGGRGGYAISPTDPPLPVGRLLRTGNPDLAQPLGQRRRR